MGSRSVDPWDDALASPSGVLRGGDPGRGDLMAELERWAADARVHEAARARARERWLRRQAEEDASLHGVLLDLAERSVTVALATASGRRHQGAIRAVGRDFVAVRADRGADLLLATTAIARVSTLPDVPAVVGDRRTLHLDLLLVDVLLGLSADRPRVLIATADGGEVVTGELRVVGTDVVTVRGDGQPPTTSYVPIAAVSDVVLL